MRIGGVVTIAAQVEGLDNVVQRLGAGLFTIAALSQTVRKYAYMAQAQAVKNVSGVQVTYSGGTFVVNRITGKLAQSISVLQVTPLAAIVMASAKYADAVEGGSKERDMKPYLLGKIIPIRARGSGGGQLAQQNGMPTQGPVYRGARMVPKYNSKGKVSKKEWISFRRVTATSKGWIIPPRPARPFMAAAGEVIEPLFAAEIAAVYAKHITGEP